MGLEGEASESGNEEGPSVQDTAQSEDPGGDTPVCFAEAPDELSVFDELTSNEPSDTRWANSADTEWFTYHLANSISSKEHPSDDSAPPQDF